MTSEADRLRARLEHLAAIVKAQRHAAREAISYSEPSCPTDFVIRETVLRIATDWHERADFIDTALRFDAPTVDPTLREGRLQRAIDALETQLRLRNFPSMIWVRCDRPLTCTSTPRRLAAASVEWVRR